MTFTINGNTLKKYEGNEEHVIIPDGVEAIADYAFYGAHQLRSVTFPVSLKEIGSDVFYDCEELQEIDLSHTKVHTIGENAFNNTKLKKIIVADKEELYCFDTMLQNFVEEKQDW